MIAALEVVVKVVKADYGSPTFPQGLMAEMMEFLEPFCSQGTLGRNMNKVAKKYKDGAVPPPAADMKPWRPDSDPASDQKATQGAHDDLAASMNDWMKPHAEEAAPKLDSSSSVPSTAFANPFDTPLDRPADKPAAAAPAKSDLDNGDSTQWALKMKRMLSSETSLVQGMSHGMAKGVPQSHLVTVKLHKSENKAYSMVDTKHRRQIGRAHV